jgi:hypothetical protein
MAVEAHAKIIGFTAMGEQHGIMVDMMFHGERLSR